jgi:tripartite-type tricarboxylate transporter receptor subunit TctC
MRTLLALLAAAIAAASPARAQSDPAAWPQRQVRVIVPFPAGSATDVVVRILEGALSPRLGQPIVVDNRSGASGSLGVDAVLKSDPDGYTMGLITASTHAVAPGLGRKLPYDPVAGFAPVGMIGSTPYVLAVFAELEAKDLAGLIALAKASPGKLNYGSAGPGSLAHLAAALLAVRSGIEIVHVPYRSTAQAVTDIVAGRIQM